jgi:deazaflavin-dependent oxidoreductase (nitroreductase family)
MPAARIYEAPTSTELFFGRVLGFLVGIGICPSYNYLLEVRGRKSGEIHSTPVNLLEVNGRQFLVAPRGRTQWVRNAEAAGEVTLKKRSVRRKFRLRPLEDSEKPDLLKTYLTRYRVAVHKFFPLAPNSPVEAFAEIAADYPAFELLPS